MENENTNKYAGLFMLGGIVIGGGMGVILLALTGNALFIALAGAGAGLGLVVGAAVDRAK